MRKLLFAASMAILAAMAVAQSAGAHRLPSFNRIHNSHVVYGDVIESYPVYKAKKSRRVCKNVEVPIYKGSSPADQTGNIVAGALIGGIVGKVVTGNDRGAAAGAVIGGIAGANKNKRHVVGYRIERQCKTVHKASGNQIKYYESRVRLEGRIYRVRTGNRLTAGDTLRMYMPN